MLVESGFSLTKLWFSVTQSEQRTRFAIRQIDPVRRWKLSPMDIESLDRWDDYTAAKEAMIEHTDTDDAPWTSIKSNDKKRARINAMRFFLNQFDYEDKDPSVVYPAGSAARAARPRLDQGLNSRSVAAARLRYRVETTGGDERGKHCTHAHAGVDGDRGAHPRA